MIAKRIRRGPRAPRGSVRKLHRFITALTRYLVDAHAADLVAIETGRRLTDYILDSTGAAALEALGVEPDEKVVYSDARNLIGDGLESWQAQMLATAARAARCRDPIEHYVLSWQSGEEPTRHQFGRAVEIALVELGLSECQAVWAVHGNTDNLHVHVAVNRVHPITGKTISAGDGWDKDRLQQICALIEHEQGWRAEKKAGYEVRGSEVVHLKTGTVVRDRNGRQTRARDRSGEQTAIPDGFEPVVDAISAATDWRDLHDRMQRLDARYVRAGPGANVIRGDARIKPSRLGRSCSLPELEKRFGPFEPSQHLDGFARYKAQCITARDKLQAARQAAIASIEGWYAAQVSGLAALGSSQVGMMLAADLDARRAAILSAVGSAFDAAEASIGKIGTERSWIAAGRPDPHAPATPAILVPSLISRPAERAPVRDLLARLHRSVNEKTRLIEYRDDHGRVVLADAGGTIIVHRAERDALESGLLLAAARWSDVKFTGDDKAREVVIELARKYRIRVFDTDGRRLLSKNELPHLGEPDRSTTERRRPPQAGVDRTDPRDASLNIEQPHSSPDGDIARTQWPAEGDHEGPDVVGYVNRRGRGSGR